MRSERAPFVAAGLCVLTVSGLAQQSPDNSGGFRMFGDRVGLTMTYIVRDGPRVWEQCREDRHSSGSVRVECLSGQTVNTRIDNAQEGVYYEGSGGGWTRHPLRPAPPSNILLPAEKTQRLLPSDPRAALLRLLPAEHREAYLFSSGAQGASGRPSSEWVFVPSLGMLRIWVHHPYGETTELISLSVGDPDVQFAPPPDAIVVDDKRVGRARSF